MSFRVSERTLMWAGGYALCFSTRYCTELYSVQWAVYHAVYSALSQYTIQCTVQWYAQSSVFSCFDALLYWSSVWTLHWPCNAQYGQEQQLNYNLVPCTGCIFGGRGGCAQWCRFYLKLATSQSEWVTGHSNFPWSPLMCHTFGRTFIIKAILNPSLG